ncbi:MAG: hypothetical protein K2H23_08465 [Oscillospiraceae bacterium]|nr:hypothetical protein [Oscillospiraceae bacterium]
MRKIKLLLAIFLTVLLMTSCGTEAITRDGECSITVTSHGRSIVLPQDTAEKLTLLAEKILSDEYTGITELLLFMTDDDVKRFGRDGLSVAVEYANTHEFPVSAVDYDTTQPDEINIVTYMRSVDSITILIDDDEQYIMANGSVFCFPQDYYDELMSYLQ